MLGIRQLLAWLLMLGLCFGNGAGAIAAPVFCRVVDGHSVCVLSLQRSAKNFWEYRAAVSVDGAVRPVEVYDCRDRSASQNENRLRHRADGKTVPFSKDIAGAIVCRIYRRSPSY
ncbi:MAG: hypothetical protein SNJ57_20325 [Cyanobacteriota bacterium]